MIWVVDSGDVDRLDDCRKEFKQILFEEVIQQSLCEGLETNGSGCSDLLQQV